MKPVDKNTARIGFFGDKYEFEAYVVTDDVCQIPHFHVRDALQMGILDAPVRLDANQYIQYGESTDKLQDYSLSLLADFMAQPCRSPRYQNNFEFAVFMWNMNNETQLQIKIDKDGNVIIPDYNKTNDNQ
jgi:hypothetical protein